MIEAFRIYCADPGPEHGLENPRKRWLDTFELNTYGHWDSAPPERSRTPAGTDAEVTHRSSKLHVTRDGDAVGYTGRQLGSETKHVGREPRRTREGRAIHDSPIDRATGRSLQADPGADYELSHTKFRLRCSTCKQELDLRQVQLQKGLDFLRARFFGVDVSLRELRRAVEAASKATQEDS